MDNTTTETSAKTCPRCKRMPQGYLCKACDKAEALELLRKWCPPGSTVYTNLHRVSRSGMSRLISLHVADETGIRNITAFAARVLEYSIDRDNLAVKVSGCGMDMGFHLVYNLSSALWHGAFPCIGNPKGGTRCPSNDHSNGDRNFRKGHKHTDGGYALLHRWI